LTNIQVAVKKFWKHDENIFPKIHYYKMPL
jgi:hypothetical protein